MPINQALSATLQMLGDAVQSAADDWWLIGSAAVALHGGAVAHVADVDLLMSVADADTLLTRVAGRRGAETSGQFRSAVFGTWSDPPLPVEVFGGFAVAREGAWHPVSFATRERISLGKTDLYVPGRQELIALLHAFGRPKDLERARSLRDAPPQDRPAGSPRQSAGS